MDDRIESVIRTLPRRGGSTLVAGVSVGGKRTVARWGPRADGSPAATTVLEIGSLTKPLTGALLADMYLRGEVGLDDPLAAHLPRAAAWSVGEATLRELATHRTGLPNTPRGMLAAELAVAAGIRRGDPWESVSEGDYHGLLARTRARRPLRRGVRYSSLGFGLLGDALASRGGLAYGDLLRERLLEPLGMGATSASGPASLPGRSRRGRPRPPTGDQMSAGGGVRSTAPDVLSWLEACLDPPGDHPGPALALAQAPHARAGRRARLGLGWIIHAADRRRPSIVWHNGLTYGFRSFGAFVPSAGLAVVALANTTRSLDRLGFALIDAALSS